MFCYSRDAPPVLFGMFPKVVRQSLGLARTPPLYCPTTPSEIRAFSSPTFLYVESRVRIGDDRHAIAPTRYASLAILVATDDHSRLVS